MGEEEHFPKVMVYDVGTLAATKLRYTKADQGWVTSDEDALVMPFGQTATINMIFRGIHPTLSAGLIDNAERWLFGPARRSKSDRIGELKKNVDNVLDEISKKHSGPLMQAVAALSRQDLAKMANSLVSLTAFLMKMSVTENETVAEPIDVAILSKGDGFIWIKHKDLVGQVAGLGL